MLLCQAAYPVLRRTGGGIVNITSLAAHGPGKWMGADYAASKAALVSLTRSLAFEAARFNVRVNAISPGMIETDMTAALTDAMRRDLAIPLGRLGAPVDVGNAAAFLLSEDSSYITGQVLHVDGGLWTGNS
jgi:3-oxoacyl-[acyl-carrier protein] reductase